MAEGDDAVSINACENDGAIGICMCIWTGACHTGRFH